MKNQNKRMKRAKLKAKKLRVEKHKLKQVRSEINIVTILPHLIIFFKTLPDFSYDLECVPLIRNFIEQQSIKAKTENIFDHVAGMLAMYCYWFNTGRDVMAQGDLIVLIDFFYEDDVFKDQFNR